MLSRLQVAFCIAVALGCTVSATLAHADDFDPVTEPLRMGCATLPTRIPGATPIDQYHNIKYRRDHWQGRLQELRAQHAFMRAHPLEPRSAWQSALDSLRGNVEMAGSLLRTCNVRLDDLSAHSMIELWTEVSGGSLRRDTIPLSRLLSSPSCKDVGFVHSNIAFSDSRAFEIWLHENGDSSRDRADFAASRNPQIKSCIERARSGVVSVNYERDDICKERWGPIPDTTAGDRVEYRIQVVNGVVEVEHKVALDYRGPAANRANVIARLERARRCAENFYASQGVVLRLTFYDDPDRSADQVVTVHQDTEDTRPLEDRWPVYPESQQTDKRLCGDVAHEIGHQLGFDDQYQHSECPDRVRGTSGDNLMYLGNFDLDRAFLDGEQMNRLISPLCKGR